jgi:hypothetical protein
LGEVFYLRLEAQEEGAKAKNGPVERTNCAITVHVAAIIPRHQHNASLFRPVSQIRAEEHLASAAIVLSSALGSDRFMPFVKNRGHFGPDESVLASKGGSAQGSFYT